MRSFCGIDIDSDRIFISLAKLRKLELELLQEENIEAAFKPGCFIEFLKEKGEDINAKIKELEKKYSVYADTIYLNLPWGLEKKAIVEANIPLRKRKKINYSDIVFAKKYLEDAYLDWDDLCLHNLVLTYNVDGKEYLNPPLGILAKRIKIKSLLFSVKDKLRREIEDIFNNLQRKLKGFIFPGLSILSGAFGVFNKESHLGAINIGWDQTQILTYQAGAVTVITKDGFGAKKILEELARKLLIPFPLAGEVFNRYVSFKDTPHFKEVSIKAQNYINLSTHTVNSFIKEYMKNECGKIFDELKDKVSLQTAFTLLGRLNAKEGLDDFMKECFPYIVCDGSDHRVLSSSFGCIRYGMLRFLEKNYSPKTSIIQQITEVYKEYF